MNIIAYCQQNPYVRLAIYTDLLTLIFDITIILANMVLGICLSYENPAAFIAKIIIKIRSSHPEVFLEKDVLKICNKFTRKHPCRSVISIKLLCKICDKKWHRGQGGTYKKWHHNQKKSCVSFYFLLAFGQRGSSWALVSIPVVMSFQALAWVAVTSLYCLISRITILHKLVSTIGKYAQQKPYWNYPAFETNLASLLRCCWRRWI